MNEAGEGASLQRLVVANAALRVVARHPSLLTAAAFKELVEVLSQHLPFAGLVALVPDGEGYQRIYVEVTHGLAPSPIGSGSRIPQMPAIDESIYVEGRPYVCNDTREGNEVHRIAAAAGFLSYVLIPIKSTDGVRAVGELAWLFREVGEASRVPVELLLAVGEVVSLGFERAVRFTRERRLAMILETSSDAMLAWDEQGRVTDANSAACRLVGVAREELLGRNIDRLLDPPPNRARGLPPPDARLVLLARGDDGAERRLPVAATMPAVEDDPLVACHALLRDLSAWELNERKVVLHLARIHELEEQHRTLLDNAPLVIFRLDPRTLELVYLNHCAERLLGIPLEEALGTHGFLRSLHVDIEGAQAYDEAVAQANAGLCSSPYEARLARRGSAAITARGTIYPLLGKEGNVVAIEGLFMDVSTEHAARTRLIQADRLTTLGTLAAGVAHEINNPAAFILLGIDMMARMLNAKDVDLGPKVAQGVNELLNELRDSTRRIVDIVRDLRMFARAPGGTRRMAVDVNRTVESALTLVRGQIVERAEVIRDFGDVPNVLIDEGRLGQVLVNLLVNAAQAIPRGWSGETNVYVTTRSENGRTVEIEVRDTGVGISPEIQERIWDPFFTTKDPGAGTGLGLSISREIIERSGGRLYVQSPVPGTNPPSGSRFVIELRASAAAISSLPPTSSSSRWMGGSARVLVIEDEQPLARALGTEIGRVHDVQVVGNATEALEVLSNSTFDAIVCDVRMPGMSGEALYEIVRTRMPVLAQRFIFMTGVGFGADIERFLSGTGRPILEKPFSAEDVLEVIRKVVSRQGKARATGT